MTTHFTELARRAAVDGQVDPADILALRRQGWRDGVITREEAEAIFALNNALDERNADWSDFFAEAIREYVLNGTEPRWYCNDSEAQWLIQQVDHDGVVDSLVELETIVRIIERAENVPDLLKGYVLDQIEREVLTGTGPTRCGGELSDAHITAAEARILRRVIFSSGGHGPASVSREEAEMLFRFKDETIAQDNAPEWDDLFLDGVCNYLKGFSLGNAQLEHGRAKELEAFMHDNEPNIARFIGRMLREAPEARNRFGKVFGTKKVEDDFGKPDTVGEQMTDEEQEWLDRMIEADGEIDDLERRLIARIVEEGE